MRMLAIALAALIPLSLLPLVATNYHLYLAELAMINIIIAVGLNLLSGNCGLISLCNASFMAIGAYATTLMSNRAGMPVALALPAAVLLSAILGAALGYPARRLSGLYLALVTLGFLELVQISVEEFPDLTGGIRGLSAPRPEIFGFKFQSDWSLYLLVLAMTACAVIAGTNIRHSRYGRAFDAVRQSPFAAQALGIPVPRIKLVAFALNAAFAGFAGGLFASVVGFIDPTEFGILTSLKHITFIVVGGLGSVAGAVIGALLLTALPEFLRATKEYGELVYAVILLATLFFIPNGLVGVFAAVASRVFRTKQKEADHGPP